MNPRRTLLLALALVALVPGPAAAADVVVVKRDESPDAARASVARTAPFSFTMVGVHWRGPGRVWFRTAGRPGAWSSWHRARPEAEDIPDDGAAEASRTAGWKLGNPWWTGQARWIQYRVSGRVTRLRTFFVRSPVASAEGAPAIGPPAVSLRASRPGMVRRTEWGADESIVRAPPFYAPRLRLAIIHHTAGTNAYSAREAGAIVRGIERYHVLANGWNDIGYNFLVDKYGRIFEGRAGGIVRNVVGAHAEGFNTGSVGVAVIGNYSSSRISRAARKALVRLLAWRLDVAHVDPLSRLTFVTYGNDRFSPGTAVRLRAISGHRDTGSTSCPGSALYGRLGRIATRVSTVGLPKLYAPKVSGKVGGLVRFTGRLSAARAWLVEVRDADGTLVARRAGTGRLVDWTWDARTTLPGAYRYRIRSGSAVRPASGRVPSPPPLAVRRLRASPRALTPNGDWSGEKTTVTFRLTRRAALGVRVERAATGALVRTLLARGRRARGSYSLRWSGRNADGVRVPDGRYRVEVTADARIEHVVRSEPLVVDRTLGGVAVTPRVVSPNGDGRRDELQVAFDLARPAEVAVRIRRKGKLLRTLQAETLAAGGHSIGWDGRRDDGKRVADGRVKAVVTAATWLGRRRLVRPARVDTTRPHVRVLSLRMVDGVARLRFTLSERARVRIWYGRRTWSDGDSIVRTLPAGEKLVRRRVRAHVVRIVARDAGRNRSVPVVYP
jgi:flagellar hook assembly protein FlgD